MIQLITEKCLQNIAHGGEALESVLATINGLVNASYDTIHEPVANLAGLKAIPAEELNDRMIVLCETLGVYRYDAESVAAPDDVGSVKPDSIVLPAAGRYLRFGLPLVPHDHSTANVGGKLAQANSHESPDTNVAVGSLHHTLGNGAFQSAPGAHAHSGAVGDGLKLAQANTHESVDTDVAVGSLHHTIGDGAFQSAAGAHKHTGVAGDGGKIAQASSHESPDTDVAAASLHHTLGDGAFQSSAGAHKHTGVAGDGGKIAQASSHESPDTDVAALSLHHTLGNGAFQSAAGAHAHTGVAGDGLKIAQASSHESPDTDSAVGSLHHTIGDGATQASAGAHKHTGVAGDGGKIAQASSHESPDTDVGAASLHHTIGAGAFQAAAGNHTHGSHFRKELFFAPAAGGTNVVPQFAGNSASPHAATAQPDVPRNLQVVFSAAWGGGDVVVTGFDAKGVAQVETFTTPGGGGTVVGTKIFGEVTQAAHTQGGAGGDTCDVQLAAAAVTILGVATYPVVDFIRLTKGVAGALVPEAIAAETLVDGSFRPTTVPNGAVYYEIYYQTTA